MKNGPLLKTIAGPYFRKFNFNKKIFKNYEFCVKCFIHNAYEFSLVLQQVNKFELRNILNHFSTRDLFFIPLTMNRGMYWSKLKVSGSYKINYNINHYNFSPSILLSNKKLFYQCILNHYIDGSPEILRQNIFPI